MEALRIDEKDKVLIAFDKVSSKYFVKEVAIHDKDLAQLFLRAKLVIEQLNGGKVPFIVTPSETKNYRYQCSMCSSREIPAFTDSLDSFNTYCPQCKRWREHKKVC
jgi:hypothetical protein